MKTNVYIDGFNFYYGCPKGTLHKWLNFRTFCCASLPGETIHHIRYFTAIVKSSPSNPDQTVRQMIYLRALETVPNLTIHHGRFVKSVKRGELIDPRLVGIDLVTVRMWEEKVSDVSLATHLVADGFRGDYEQAVVLSNDSDLVEPIVLVQTELKLPVVVLSPHGPSSKPSYHLRQVASSYRVVDRSLLNACQFPTILSDANGTITKPATW